MADRKAHEDGACSVERKVGKSWKLLPDSIQGRLGVGHVMNLKYDETCFTNINLRKTYTLSNDCAANLVENAEIRRTVRTENGAEFAGPFRGAA